MKALAGTISSGRRLFRLGKTRLSQPIHVKRTLLMWIFTVAKGLNSPEPKSKKIEITQPGRKDCISGFEDLTRYENRKVKQQFRFNRIRSVPNDTPSHGRLPVNKF
jgi:hypothetical protein